MVEGWRGTLSISPDSRQHEVFEALNVRGLCSLEDAARLLGSERVGDPDIPEAEQARLFEALIQEGHRVIVTCRPGLLARAIGSKGLSSPHGPLPGDGFPHHALYVFGASEEQLDVYDPWHHPRGQPIRLSWDELGRAWTGMMLVATK